MSLTAPLPYGCHKNGWHRTERLASFRHENRWFSESLKEWEWWGKWRGKNKFHLKSETCLWSDSVGKTTVCSKDDITTFHNSYKRKHNQDFQLNYTLEQRFKKPAHGPFLACKPCFSDRQKPCQEIKNLRMKSQICPFPAYRAKFSCSASNRLVNTQSSLRYRGFWLMTSLITCVLCLVSSWFFH